MTAVRTYPEGVPSWIDLEHPDVDDAIAFYGELFGWQFSDASPTDMPFRYVVASLDGRDVAALGGPTDSGDSATASSAWNTYIAVDDAAAVAARVEAAGGRVVAGPSDAGDRGRFASCVDPDGVPFRLWQARAKPGAQIVNTPGAWNFSDLHAADPAASAAYYTEVFGWSVDDIGFAEMIRQPGYGDHLAATSDPEIHDRQSGVKAPPGFADAIAWLAPVEPDEEPHWHVSFTVADRDATVETLERLGGSVLGQTDTDWTRDAVVRDPQGAVFTASQFAPG